MTRSGQYFPDTILPSKSPCNQQPLAAIATFHSTCAVNCGLFQSRVVHTSEILEYCLHVGGVAVHPSGSEISSKCGYAQWCQLTDTTCRVSWLKNDVTVCKWLSACATNELIFYRLSCVTETYEGKNVVPHATGHSCPHTLFPNVLSSVENTKFFPLQFAVTSNPHVSSVSAIFGTKFTIGRNNGQQLLFFLKKKNGVGPCQENHDGSSACVRNQKAP